MFQNSSIARRLWRYTSNRYALPLIGVFLAVLGSRLWLIQSYGNDVPFWDQWNAEGLLLYKPMIEGGYGAVDWFASHNEHRIVLARLASVAMLLINGQWDPLLQVCWEAVCAALIATLLCFSAMRLMPGRRAIGLVFGLVLIGLTMPYGWANTLGGFQSPFYYLLLLAFSIFHLCAYRGSLTLQRSVVVCVLGALSLGTVAAGALACLAGACALIARLLFARPSEPQRVVGLVIALIALTLLGYGTTPPVPAHAALHARGFAQSLQVFNIVLGWPTKLGCLVWLPFAAWCLQSVLRRRIGPPGLFLVGLAVFVLLNAAATATARGGSILDVADLASRYTDIAWCAWLVNLMAAILLVQRGNDERSTGVRSYFVNFVFVGAAVALAQAGLSALPAAAQLGGYYALSSQNTRSYVATGNQADLRDKVPGSIPYPSADDLIKMIDDPTIRALLPPGVRQGVLARSGASLESLARGGLVLGGIPPGNPAAPPEFLGHSYGTWGDDGNGHTARFVSEPVKAQGPAVRTLVSGYLGGPGLSLYLEDVTSGKRVDLVPVGIAAGNWTIVRAPIPGPTYRLVVEDAATGDGSWFAFTDPIELGRLRGLTEFFLRIGKDLTLLGLSLFLTIALATAPPQTRDETVHAG